MGFPGKQIQPTVNLPLLPTLIIAYFQHPYPCQQLMIVMQRLLDTIFGILFFKVYALINLTKRLNVSAPGGGCGGLTGI